MSDNERFTSIFPPFKSMNPSVEHLVGDLIEYRTSIETLKVRHAADPEKLVLLEACEHKINEAQKALIVKRPYHRKKIFVVWDMFHQVSADLILFMPLAELLAFGRKLIIDVKQSPLSDAARTDWVVRLIETMKKLEANNPSEDVIEQARQLFRTITITVNTQADTMFWDIWTEKFINVCYIALLLIHFIVLYCKFNAKSGFDITAIGSIALIGAIGGTLSGLFSGNPQYIAKGHFWAYIFYYTLVRPMQGAFAAIAVFWMLQAQYLIKIDPPLDDDTVIFSSVSSACSKPALSAACTEQRRQKFAAMKNHSSAKNTPSTSLIVLNSAPGKQAYMYLLVLLIAGFSGDKLLKAISDKVTGKLFAEADKTKDVK
jgi:hypothetical protein